MKRMLLACGLLVLPCLSCAGTSNFGFGPYPSSSFAGGQLTAGVAGFIPGSVPGEGDFLLVIFNTDSRASHNVVVTPEGDLALSRTIAPCSVGNVAVSCSAPSVLIEIMGTNAAAPPAFTFMPDPDNCQQKVVYIAVPVDTSAATGTTDTTGTTGTTTATPSLTDTLPPSAATCGFGDLSNITLP